MNLAFNELKEKLLATETFIDNEYLDLYCELIILNKILEKIKYRTQIHHIIPQSYFKLLKKPIDNSLNNLVNLFYKDHILTHYYLCLCTEGQLKYKMANAFFHLANRKNKYFDFDPEKDLDQYLLIYELWMSDEERFSNLIASLRDYFDTRSEEEANRVKELQSKSRKDLWQNLSLEDRASRISKQSKSMLNRSIELRIEFTSKLSESYSKISVEVKNLHNEKRLKSRGLESFESVKNRISKPLLYSLYIEQNKTKKEILALFNVDHNMISLLISFYGIVKYHNSCKGVSKNFKKVLCIETGMQFNSCKEAGLYYGRDPSGVTSAIKNNGTFCGYHWRYINKNEI